MKKYIFLWTFTLLAITGCNRVDETESDFDNKVFIREASVKNTETVLLKPLDVTLQKTWQTSLALPTDKDVVVKYKVDMSLVSRYNSMNGTLCEALPEEFYEIPETETQIVAGNVNAEDLVINFKNLANFPRGERKSFVLPVTIESATHISPLQGSRTMYYLVREGAPIVTAANINKTSLALVDPSASTLKDLTAITMEMLIRPQAFAITDASISSLMGVEGYFLMRIGDAGIPNNQIQIAKSTSFGGNWLPNNGLKTNVWQHVALTFNLATGDMILYIDGKVTGRAKQRVSSTSLKFNQTSGDKFFIGESYGGRHFNGEVSEIRIWKVVRTQSQLNEFKYKVASDAPGLEAYWKCNEEKGNSIHDYTEHGNELTVLGTRPSITWSPIELGGEE